MKSESLLPGYVISDPIICDFFTQSILFTVVYGVLTLSYISIVTGGEKKQVREQFLRTFVYQLLC